jgi:peptidoglycan glycosyltransferase
MEGSKVVCTGAHGTQTLEQAFANSCNCAFAKITELVGRDNMNYYVQRFGVTQPLSFDGIVTRTGNFDIEDTDRLGLCWSGIGQHRDLVNPCSYLGFVSAVASGGATVMPYVVDSVTVGSDTTYRAHYPDRVRIMSRDTARTLQELMRNNVVIKYGADRFPNMKVCAKSGTAETGSGESNALFTGFVTDEKYPLAFLVVVEEGGYGSKACIPVISKVLSAYQEIVNGQ